MPKRTKPRLQQVLEQREAFRADIWGKLAQYNAEVARGIVHTPEWDKRMASLQAQFDAETADEAQWEADDYVARRRQRVNLKPKPVAGLPTGM